ncbi:MULTISPECIES: hypothetical protein [unclassified Kitasatospora]|uniref:hypothetical protein n=1 Tax=unclassified Kitasatospora TaxID=2633591 RepID=UPI003817BAD0
MRVCSSSFFLVRDPASVPTSRRLFVHPRRAARTAIRRLPGPRRPPIHPPALAASGAR